MSDTNTNTCDYEKNIYDLENENLSDQDDNTVVVGDVDTIDVESKDVTDTNENTEEPDLKEATEESIEFTAEEQNEIYDSIIKLNREGLLIKCSKALTDLSSNMTSMVSGQSLPYEVLMENVSREIIYLEAVLRYTRIDPDRLNSAMAERFVELKEEISTPEAKKEIERVNKLIEESRAAEQAHQELQNSLVFEKNEDGSYVPTGLRLNEVSKMEGVKLIFENDICVNIGKSVINVQ